MVPVSTWALLPPLSVNFLRDRLKGSQMEGAEGMLPARLNSLSRSSVTVPEDAGCTSVSISLSISIKIRIEMDGGLAAWPGTPNDRRNQRGPWLYFATTQYTLAADTLTGCTQDTAHTTHAHTHIHTRAHIHPVGTPHSPSSQGL